MLPLKAPPMLREHRLYQADWLLRHYGYRAHEVASAMPDGHLDLAIDPKLAWALAHRDAFPVDINADDRERLLRIPGIGVRNVDRLLKLRKHRRVRYADLVKLRCNLDKARPFIIAADHAPRDAERSSARLRTTLPRVAEQLVLL
jgi:predicted DNA-binding helix-hairpin-helix protein